MDTTTATDQPMTISDLRDYFASCGITLGSAWDEPVKASSLDGDPYNGFDGPAPGVVVGFATSQGDYLCHSAPDGWRYRWMARLLYDRCPGEAIYPVVSDAAPDACAQADYDAKYERERRAHAQMMDMAAGYAD